MKLIRTAVVAAAVLCSLPALAELQDVITKGSTDRSVTVKIIDATTGVPSTDIVFNSAGIDLWYRREGAASVDVTEATLAALTTAHTDGGFLHINDGVYRLDLPDAAFATGANYVDFGGTVTGEIVIGGRVRLVNANLEDSVRLGLTSLPNAPADAAGGLPISDAGGLDLDALKVNVDDIETDTADMQPKLGTFPNLGSGGTLAGNLEDMRDDGTAAFDRATDSQQAIRDRGDAAWDTATGFSTHSAADVWSVATRILTAGTNIALAKGTGVTGFNDLSAAQVNAEVDTALADYDGPTHTELTTLVAELAQMLGVRTTVSALSSQTAFTPTAAPTSDAQLPGWGVLLIDAGDANAYSLRKVVSASSGEITINKAADFTLATTDVVVFLPAFTNEPAETAFVYCEVNTANFAGSTTTLACILTDKDGAAVTAASGDLTGLELRVTSGAQIYEGRFINSTTWDAVNSELQLTLSRALPATLADGVTAIIR